MSGNLCVPVMVHDINLNAVIWSLTMVEEYCGLTPFVTWVFSFCRQVGFAAHLKTQRNQLIEPLTLFSKVGRVASQNVVIELLMSKCVPVLYYGSECCQSPNVSSTR